MELLTVNTCSWNMLCQFVKYFLMSLACVLLLVVTATAQADVKANGGTSPSKEAIKTLNARKPDCFVNVRKRSKHHGEPLECRDDFNPLKQNLKCEVIIDKKSPIPCCNLKKLCNSEGYCRHGKMECFGHKGRNFKCVCHAGFRGRRCNMEVKNVTIPCDCHAEVKIKDNCKDVHFRDTEQCFTTNNNPNHDTCLCNNKQDVDLTKHPKIPNCNVVGVTKADIDALTDTAIAGPGIILTFICATTLVIVFFIFRHSA